MTTLCSPWVDLDQVRYCTPSAEPDGQFQRALEAASWLLYAATGYQWPGICTDVIRPCAAGTAGQALQNATGEGSRALPGGEGCGCGGGSDLDCGCNAHPSVILPGQPVVDVTEVLLDGVAFTEHRLIGDRYLIRRDGGAWPCCQNLGLASTEVGTWEITYRYGSVPGPAGALAVEVLACELVSAWPPNDCTDCRLPRRLTQATYEGASFAVLDPFTFLDQGRFGIFEVDAFVVTANGGRTPGQPPAKVLSAAEMFGGSQRARP